VTTVTTWILQNVSTCGGEPEVFEAGYVLSCLEPVTFPHFAAPGANGGAVFLADTSGLLLLKIRAHGVINICSSLAAIHAKRVLRT
jgi:hypothetical protein